MLDMLKKRDSSRVEGRIFITIRHSYTHKKKKENKMTLTAAEISQDEQFMIMHTNIQPPPPPQQQKKNSMKTANRHQIRPKEKLL